GEIVEIFAEESFAAFRRPTVPISLASSKIHGISDFDVRETSISDHAVRKVVEPAQLVVAHNAAFDRPMVEKHWPIFSNKHWACSLVDVDWKEEGASSAALESLLYMQRWFYEGHRALSDATAALFLMTLPLPVTRKQAMTSLLISARKPLFAVRAEHAAFEQRALLKQRGYRWDAGGDGRPKGWWMLTSSPDEETRWLSSEVFASPRAIPVISVPPTKRFSSRMWEA
ncbi:MAG TPA: 3'-5' exonuclease, partial [Hyphomonadaceae bacterium]|nr:3'-5' exonuclease [Hyphomonadaceae bacterium]